jgi:SAM-dependent methyltransferase
MGAGTVAKRIVSKAFSVAGVDAHLFRKNHNLNMVVFNRNYLSRYYKDDPFMILYREAMEKTNSESRDSFEKQCRFSGLYQAIRRVLNADVPGSFAECGCWRGHSALMTAKLIHASGQNRELHIFDSFEGGLSDKLAEDKGLLAKTEPNAVRREKEAFASTEEEVLRAMGDFNFVSLHKGWIPERFGDVQDKTFAFVNLDVDLYQPITDSLNFFLPRLSKGGILVVDDYGTTDWPGVTTAVDQFLDHNPVTFAIETLGSMIILK